MFWQDNRFTSSNRPYGAAAQKGIMMRIAVIAHDKPDHLQVRIETREAHLAYIKQTGVVEMAGPFLNADNQMCGSLIVLNVTDLTTAEAWAANDPYSKAGLFETITLRKWKKVIG